MKELKVDEEFRTYILECGIEYTIKNVVKVSIADTGSHRVTDSVGVTHYIPSTFKTFYFKGDIVA